MRRILLLTILALSIYTSKSQDLSYSCPRDTILGCNATCLTIKHKFPDVRAIGADYTFQEVTSAAACKPYVDPGGAGPSTSLSIDDTYSSEILLPFPFTFYGSVYNSLIVSTNGYISFDVAEAGNFSHYGILNAGGFLSATTGNPAEDLPSTLYDRAIIMGPYHDLDPSETTSPTQQIKYNVYGNAPNRQWILSFYKVPLFLTACNSLIENTCQIILYESSGVVEVFVGDQEICTGWNEGRAMIGLQDFTQTKGIMAPGRRASDPPWGTIGMNETWRFIPTGGAPLYRKVELLDGTGAVIATADTTRLDINTFETSFPNICPPAGTSVYVVKTTYQKIDDPTPGATQYSLDTIRVIRQAALPVTAVPTATACGLSTGTIVATASGGAAPYTFTMTGPGGPYGPFVSATNTYTFSNLAAGVYTVSVTEAGGCIGPSSPTTINNIPNLTGAYTVNGATCPGINDAVITVTPTLGAAAGPYTFVLTGPGGPYTQLNVVSTATFTGLAGGTYSVTFSNAAACSGTITGMILSPGTAPTVSLTKVNTSCSGANDGIVTATFGAASGASPYTVTLNPGAIVQTGVVGSASFTGLAANFYTVSFTNATGCAGNGSISVFNGTSPTAAISKTNTTCPGIDDGTVTVTPAGGASQGPYTITLNPGGFVQTGVALAATFSGLPPNTYNATFSNVSGCTGNTTSVIVLAGPAVTGTAVSTSTSCPTVNDGTITITPGGTGPYTYTLNPGSIVQPNNPVFINLAPGPYTVSFTTGSGCNGTVSPNPVVAAGPFLTSTFTKTNPVCANINDGTITITPAGVPGYTFVLTGPGGPYTQATATFSNLAPGTYNYSFTDGNGCTGTGGPIVLTTNPPLATTVTLTMPLCNGTSTGIIVLAASGGVAPYEYALSPFTAYQPTGTFNNLPAGIYTFRIKDFAGCTKDTTVTLSEPSLLTAAASNTAVASCSGNDGTITVTGFGGTIPYQYSINNGANYQASGVFTAPTVGAYPNIIVKDANGCTANASTTVSYIDAMFLTLGNDTTICVGSSVKLQPQTNTGTSIFKWRPLDGSATLANTIDNVDIREATMTPLDTATYILHATWGACFREDTITVNILHKPIPNAGLDTAICDQTYAILRGSATNLSGNVYYVWSPASSVDDDSSAVTIAHPGSLSQYYTLTVTDDYGCNFLVKDSVFITVQPPVPAFAGNDTIAILGVPHQLYASGGVSYLWSPAAPLNLATVQNPLATLTADQKFTVIVTDIAGCIGYDTVFVQAYLGPNYYVPNAFSPNGDGLNDVFRAIPVGIAKTEWFRVFNRYGQLMFETNQWLKGWDGKYKGKLQPTGVYVWIVKGEDKNGRLVEMKGTVMIVQ